MVVWVGAVAVLGGGDRSIQRCRGSSRVYLIRVAWHSHRGCIIKFCASFSRPSSSSTSITDTVSYLISYLPPLYFHPYGQLTVFA